MISKKKKKKRDISHAYRFSLPGSPLTLSVSSLSSNLLLHPRPTPSEPKTKPPTSQDNGDRREFPQLQSLHLPAFIPILFLSLLPQGKKGLSYPQPTPPHSCSLTHLRYSFLSLSLSNYHPYHLLSLLALYHQHLNSLPFNSTGVSTYHLHLSLFTSQFLESTSFPNSYPLESSHLNSTHSPPFLTSHSPLSPLQPGFCQKFH